MAELNLSNFLDLDIEEYKARIGKDKTKKIITSQLQVKQETLIEMFKEFMLLKMEIGALEKELEVLEEPK
ncbi:hypothetical protein [Campylobacter helveticus]|uniref:Uncharacterized protein n=1 Tax=Campylobacter helveticus TaxID=28898 RepID=A0AAX2UKP9_9BACT|nr:hypothetical protein [Campylobacter helveticus]EAH5199932.1 hypothetical protein [Campylobacter upsaliensis]EFP2059515.1 hypothetical protein [Campylobacter jejuni]ARE81490.1 hypothetical protein CHELV3228_b0027 [Campylobacter helveticus]EAK1046668.1 hypothetical protein [Campylobacter upsaliensis]EAK9971332.1 hypothetical protein [Campylobacter upsaliensis]